ncbi:MAG: Crp/Fnr family transcriptional regulator [Flavobacteriales bacterium]|nr:Crp/Fnr family transcriptional regulator [Flavobacteriales bacterium]
MEALKKFFNNQVPVPALAWILIRSKFTEVDFKANEYLIKEGQIARFNFFIVKGIIRTFYIKNGKEITVDFGLENSFITSYSSFFTDTPSRCFLAALEPVKCYKISKKSLFGLYDEHKLGERIGRTVAEKKFLQKEFRESALLLDSPKERFDWLQENQKDWVQRIPQQYLASYIGITPETYSRYRNPALNQKIS